MQVWRERLQRWFEPVARRCPFSPNAISVAALLLAVAASVCHARAATDRRLFIAGLVLVGVSGLLDAFDGIVARVQNRSSRFGDFLDHFCDRIADTAILAGWLLGAGVATWIALLALALVMLVGYAGTQVEASFGKRSYAETGRGEFVLAMIIFPLISFATADVRWRWGALAIADLLALLLIVVACIAIAQRLKLAHAISISQR